MSEKTKPINYATAAKPVDDFESLELSRKIVAGQRPDLSPDEQLDLSLQTAADVRTLENLLAERAIYARQVDDLFEHKK